MSSQSGTERPEKGKEPMSLQRLLAEPKGKLTYHPNQAFLLHVFWEAPNATAAKKVLAALQRCADATHRDTPCVPTYFFHHSSLDADLVSEAPKLVSEHKQLSDAIRKLKVGVPRPAVVADLNRRGFDASLLDAALSDPLPDTMREDPVMLEFTELYLDERSFYEHAGSRDYLDAYGEVLSPGLQNRAVTVRLGTPTDDIAEKILAPMLKEKVEPVPEDCTLWKRLAVTDDAGGFLLAISAVGSTDEVVAKMPAALLEESSSNVAFPHPLSEERVRVLCFLPSPPSVETLLELSSTLQPAGIEIHCRESRQSEIMSLVEQASLETLVVIDTTGSGYVVHQKADQVEEED